MFSLMISFMFLFCVLSPLDAKSVKLQIDFEDVIKLMNGLSNPIVFRKFASEITETVKVKDQKYNNPYHPEDDLVETVRTMLDENDAKYERSKMMKKSAKISKNAKIEANFDKQNDEFNVNDLFLREDMLEEIKNEVDNQNINMKEPKENIIKKFKEPITQPPPAPSNAISKDDNDKKGFQPMQRRFVLKSN